MSGGYGHIAKIAKGNQLKTAQRRERLKKYKKSGVFSNSKIKLKFKEVSKEKIEEIKQRYLKELEKEKRKNRLLIFMSIVISIPLFYYLVHLFFNQIIF